MNRNLMTLPAEYCRNIMSLARKPPHWKSHVNGLCRTQTDQRALTVANRVAFVMNIRTRKVSFCTGSERSDHSTECICIGVILFSCAASL